MTGVLKTILFLLVVYYVWKLLFRLLFPIVAKKMMNKAQQTMEERMRQAQEAQNGQHTYADQQGDVIIQKGAEKKKKGGVSESEGEYVEFEEIKE
jgi:hypothetical protein